jgi:hypothetical protein
VYPTPMQELTMCGEKVRKSLILPQKSGDPTRVEQCYGSETGRIGIVMADPDRHLGPADPDPYLFQPNVKLN